MNVEPKILPPALHELHGGYGLKRRSHFIFLTQPERRSLKAFTQLIGKLKKLIESRKKHGRPYRDVNQKRMRIEAERKLLLDSIYKRIEEFIQ